MNIHPKPIGLLKVKFNNLNQIQQAHDNKV